MRIRKIDISNLRSIVASQTIPVSNLLALVGENNAGKSNILIAVGAFLAGGSGGLKEEDFNDRTVPIIIKIMFEDLTDFEKKRWKKYLVEGKLILEKRVWIETDEESGSHRIKSEYHGYEASPADWFLSIDRIREAKGERPKWAEIVAENGLPEYFLEDGKCNKGIYTSALSQYIEENEVTFNEPDLSKTHALGLQSKVVASLPAYYLLPAITDYSDEIDKRQKSSTFRRLMGELSERILKNDSRFGEIEQALSRVHALLNDFAGDGTEKRLDALANIESQIGGLLKELMPSITAVKLAVQIEELKDLFSAGVTLSVDDGVETNVLAKGHGLQRCIVFSLLRTLIETERNNHDHDARQPRSIILGIEEPELYIHPQLAKLFYDVMRAFGETDQVLYTTHSPLFIDAYRYQEVAIVSKPDIIKGTKAKTAISGIFDALDDRKVFKGLSRFNPAVNELFFAKNVLIVEGPEDLIAVTATLVKLGKIKNRVEEIEWTILVAGGKEAIPFFQRVMNAFDITYAVLHDVDIDTNTPPNDAATHRKINNLGDGLT
jgi:putative ATP-dependent endonuclease of OLD family